MKTYPDNKLTNKAKDIHFILRKRLESPLKANDVYITDNNSQNILYYFDIKKSNEILINIYGFPQRPACCENPEN